MIDEAMPSTPPSHWFISTAGRSTSVTPTKLMPIASTSGHSVLPFDRHQPMANIQAAIQIGAM